MKLIKFLKPYLFIALLSPLLMFIEVFVDLYQPKLMSVIVDQGVLTQTLSVVIRTGLIMLSLALLGGIVGVAAAGFASAAAQNFGNDLRCAAFERVMSLSLQQTDRFTTGSLVTRLTNDIMAVQEFVSMSLRMFVRTPILFLGGIFMLTTLNVTFSTAVLFALIPLAVIIGVFIAKAGTLFGEVQQKLDGVNSVVHENVSGARVVKAYVREEYEIGRFAKANRELMEKTYRVQKLMATLLPYVMIIMNAVVVAVLLLGGYQTDAGHMEVGQVMAAVTYLTQIMVSIFFMTMLLQTITRASASAKRVIEVLDTFPAILPGEKVCGERIRSVEFIGVEFQYPDSAGRPVLCDINLRINEGETFAILGATGSGKSSLVQLIPRFYDVSAGEVRINGVPVQEYEISSLRERIGYILQKSELFSGTVFDNIRWGDESADEKQIIGAAKTAQAHEFIESFHNGYQTVIGEKGASLSGGQKQRLAIARAIAKKPDLLIFDDSTSALDLGTEARLQRALKETLGGTTVIIIAQRIASVKNADRILVLDNGTACACGTHEDLLASSEIYRDIYHSQTAKAGEIS